MSVAILERHECNYDVVDIIRRVSPLVDKVPDGEARLRKWLRTSEQVWFGLYDGEVACAWGLAPSSIVSNRAYLWLVTTDIVDQHRFIFIRHSQIIVSKALEIYPTIIGHVEVGNDKARKWLKWLGADFGISDGRMTTFMIRRR